MMRCIEYDNVSEVTIEIVQRNETALCGIQNWPVCDYLVLVS